MSNPKTIRPCDRLKLFRKRLGLNQSEMAGALHISTVGYQRYESGERDIPAVTIDRAREHIGLNPRWIFEGEGDMLLPGPGPERARIWRTLHGTEPPPDRPAPSDMLRMSDEGRRLMESVIADLLQKFHARKIQPNPAMFSKLCLMCFELIVERPEHDKDAVMQEMDAMIK